MESPVDKEWSSKYLAKTPVATQSRKQPGPISKVGKSKDEKLPGEYPTPPTSTSPNRSSFHPSNPFATSHRKQASVDSANEGSSEQKRLVSSEDKGKGRNRGNSLGERFPGDMSHRPLDQIRKEAKSAYRAPHLRKKHIPGADLIDSLDVTAGGIPYHHGGPYDATLLARNTSYKSSPIEAVHWTNQEALKATPKDLVRDALDKHVPLQGTAVIPPGFEDLSGQRMDYEEGADLMREADAPGGAYRRFDGVKYLPGDLKGKGEPSYSIEKALKDHSITDKNTRRVISDGNDTYEMQARTRPGAPLARSHSGTGPEASNKPAGESMRYTDFEGDVRRSSSTGGRMGQGLKKRFGSLRRSGRTAEIGGTT